MKDQQTDVLEQDRVRKVPTKPTLTEHLDPDRHPKRILSLDGGGVRGAITLAFLAQIEKLLRERYADEDLRLSQYFDLIGGTSTGAIIAAALSLGLPVARIRHLYRGLARRIFKKPVFRIGALVPKFKRRNLEIALKDTFGPETKLGSHTIKTGLAIITKRADTQSLWLLTNNPKDEYYAPKLGQSRIGNANMLLWQIIRASTAAPHYFRPEEIVVGTAPDPRTGNLLIQRGLFIDGGASVANNPSFQLLKIIRLPSFGFNWSLGERKLFLLSLGTGLPKRQIPGRSLLTSKASIFAMQALRSVIDDCTEETEAFLQWMSRNSTGRQIDRRLGDLSTNLLCTHPLLTYHRYNICLQSEWAQDVLGLSLAPRTLLRLSKMDRAENIPDLEYLGETAAEVLVRPEHFAPVFDIY